MNKEIGKWCKDNLDMEGMYAGGAEITDYHTGEYYWETQCEGKYLHMHFDI